MRLRSANRALCSIGRLRLSRCEFPDPRARSAHESTCGSHRASRAGSLSCHPPATSLLIQFERGRSPKPPPRRKR